MLLLLFVCLLQNELASHARGTSKPAGLKKKKRTLVMGTLVPPFFTKKEKKKKRGGNILFDLHVYVGKHVYIVMLRSAAMYLFHLRRSKHHREEKVHGSKRKKKGKDALDCDSTKGEKKAEKKKRGQKVQKSTKKPQIQIKIAGLFS